MKASDFVKESFDSQVQGKLVRATNDLFTTRATIGNRDIIFNATCYLPDEQRKNGSWEIEFTEKTVGNTTYGKSGSGNEMQVFSFVIESIKELIARYTPLEIQFSSHKADGNRTKLYQRMAARIKLPGYKLMPIDSSGVDDHFTFTRDKNVS
jgi:hypothetical protein